MHEELGNDWSRVSRFTFVLRDSRLSAELMICVLVWILRFVRVPEVLDSVVEVDIALPHGVLSSFSSCLALT